MESAVTNTRTIARSAVREELARGAFPRFCAEGFDAVTLEDLAKAAGVSRSTFLRYFGSKEEVVLFTFDPLGDAMVAALQARPAGEGEWTALRRALDPVVERLTRDPAEGLALLRLIGSAPGLCARLREKKANWRPGLVEVLALRAGDSPSLPVHARVAAALECLVTAFEHWTEDTDLTGLVDEAFDALAPRSV